MLFYQPYLVFSPEKCEGVRGKAGGGGSRGVAKAHIHVAEVFKLF